jgi:L-lysine exporter family protein LysE/ArgO
MISAFLTGFFLGMSIIIAIGAQNAFVLRQGIIGKHVFYLALFCSVSDAILICIGVIGAKTFLNNFFVLWSEWIFYFAAIWLFGYGLLRLKDAYKIHKSLESTDSISMSLKSTLSTAALLTFANPHVYLDTVVLIGSISQQFSAEYKIAYTLGASVASFIFFFSLAYGAKTLSPLLKKPNVWALIDIFIAVIMFALAFKFILDAQSL